MRRRTVGFIGTGIRGSQLLGEFQKIGGVRPVAVADLYDGYLARAKEQTGGRIETTKDYRAALSRQDVDAVAIAMPDHLHRQMTMEALA
ncbi:MAG: Gfo/Idh/MocA family protein, partial [Bryobacteraceae bacterium]